MQASCSLSLSVFSLSLSRFSLSVAVQVVSVLLVVWQGGHCARANTRNHSMSSSASDDLTSAYTGSDDICSSDYACNSEDVKTTTNPERDDDPDSAELSSNYDHECNESGSAGSVSQAVSRQDRTPIEIPSKKRKLRMMDEDSDGVRVKIIPCVKQQFRRRMEATKGVN